MAAPSARAVLRFIFGSMDLEPGSEVICSAFGYPVVPYLAKTLGFELRFADCELQTLGMDPDALAEVISDRTAVVIATHLYGVPCRIREIAEISQRHGASLIEDCAHCYGAAVGDTKAGAFGRAAYFSFETSKVINTMGGGMMTSTDPQLAQRAREIRKAEPPKTVGWLAKRLLRTSFEATVTNPLFFNAAVYPALRFAPRKAGGEDRFASGYHGDEISMRGKMGRYTNYQAGLGLWQAERVAARVERQVANAERLMGQLRDRVTFQEPAGPDVRANYMLVTARFPDMPTVCDRLLRAGVDSKHHYMRDCTQLFEIGGSFPNAARAEREVLHLPAYPELTGAQIDRMAKKIADVVDALRRERGHGAADRAPGAPGAGRARLSAGRSLISIVPASTTHVVSPALPRPTWVEGIALATDLALFFALTSGGCAFNPAQMISYLVSALLCVAMPLAITSRRLQQPWTVSGWRLLGAATLAAAAALFLRTGLLALLTERLGWPPALAIVLPALLAALVFRWGLFLLFVPGRTTAAGTPTLVIMGLLVYAIALRLLAISDLELLHEEAYYWNYAQHLDWGYLDHPPMVGWIIWVFTSVLGDTEFAVRLGAFSLWFLGAFYVYRLAQRIFGSATAWSAVLLFAALPVYFGFAFVMLPDSSLVVAWAGAIYFLYRLLIDEEPLAFLGIGVWVGIGLLSKYTIGLVGVGALAFVLIDRPSRKWLWRPEPWLALAMALALFSPVIIWNARHEWMSFVFQGPDRLGGRYDFDLPDLLGSVLLLITPTGLVAFIGIVRSGRPFVSDEGTSSAVAQRERRTYRLLMTLAVVPLSVFVVFSLFRNIKLNWTGPLWLASLPYLARQMVPGVALRPWLITIVALLLFYGAGLTYLTLGIPGVPPVPDLLGQGWREVAGRIEREVEAIEDRTGERPLVVGLDADRINSWLAFYRGQSSRRRSGLRTNSAAYETSGEHLLGKEGSMYRFWFPLSEPVPATLILVGRKPEDLTAPNVERRFDRGSDVQTIEIERNGHVIRRSYYRIVEGYRRKAS